MNPSDIPSKPPRAVTATSRRNSASSTLKNAPQPSDFKSATENQLPPPFYSPQPSRKNSGVNVYQPPVSTLQNPMNAILNNPEAVSKVSGSVTATPILVQFTSDHTNASEIFGDLPATALQDPGTFTGGRSPSVVIGEASEDECDPTQAEAPKKQRSDSVSKNTLPHTVADDSNEIKFLKRHFPEICHETIRGIASCSLERDLNWHGKLVFTDSHMGFYGKIFKKAARVLVPWKDVLTIDKKSTIGIFPNAIKFSTLHSKYTFSAFLKRDAVFRKLMECWHSDLAKAKSLLVEQSRVYKSEYDLNVDKNPSDVSVASNFSDPVSEVKETKMITITSFDNLNIDLFGDDAPIADGSLKEQVVAMHELIPKKLNRAESAMTALLSNTESSRRQEATVYLSNNITVTVSTSNLSKTSDSGGDLSLPSAPVSCKCQDNLKHKIVDEVIEGLDVLQLFHLLYEKEGASFMSTTFAEKGIEHAPWSEGEKRTRILNYNVPFKAPMMPASSTKCTETQELSVQTKHFFTVVLRSKTPSVPFGDCFEVVCRYCYSFETAFSTRLKVEMFVDFKKSTYFESKIEKGAVEGVAAHVQELLAAVRSAARNDKELIKTLPRLSKLERPESPDKGEQDLPEPKEVKPHATPGIFDPILELFTDIHKSVLGVLALLVLLTLFTLVKKYLIEQRLQAVSELSQMPQRELETILLQGNYEHFAVDKFSNRISDSLETLSTLLFEQYQLIDKLKQGA